MPLPLFIITTTLITSILIAIAKAVIIAAVMAGIGIAAMMILQPKSTPDDEPDKASIEDFPAMTIAEDRPVTAVYGTTIVTPACIVQGRPDRKRIRKDLS